MSALTVIIPNYNHAKYLPECLESIVSQSFCPDAIIVVDDKSTDHSVEIVQEFQKKYPMIKLIENERNQGVILTANQTVFSVETEYVMFCTADDLIFPQFFELSMQVLKAQPAIGLCCSDACEFYDRKPYHFKKISLSPIPLQMQPNESMKLFSQTSFWIPSHSTIYRTKCFIECGMLNENLKYLCDWYLNCRIASQYPIAYIPHCSSAVRLLPSSYARVLRRDPKERTKIFDDLLDLISKESLTTFFQRSGLLGQVGVHMISHLIKRPSFWGYLPRAFWVKLLHFCHRYMSIS